MENEIFSVVLSLFNSLFRKTWSVTDTQTNSHRTRTNAKTDTETEAKILLL